MSVHALPSQSFQAISNSGKQLRNGFSIVTETCSTTGLLVIRWHRVLEALPGAGSVLLGKREVFSFLKDKDDNRLYPLRLKAYPKRTLTIVVFDSTTRHDENHYPYPSSPVSPLSLSLKSMPKPLSNTTFDTQTDQKGTKQDAAMQSNSAKQSSKEIQQLHNSRADEGHLSPPPPKYDNSLAMTHLIDLLISLAPEPMAVMNIYIQKYCSCIQSLQAGRTIRAASCAGEMEKLLEQLSFEKYRNEPLRDHLNHMSRRLSEVQELLLETHQNALVELKTIQNRVQSVFQEATGNSAHRSPRLFVVLPVAGSSSDSHSRRFRVFFWCGCETYTRATTLGSKVVHLLHLSNHEGYDLKDPALFFDRFGSLVLGMMMLLKHGYSSSKVAVPPCKNGKLFRGYKAQQSCPLLATQCAETLVDETIGFIQARTTQEIQSEADWDQVLPYLHTHNEDCDIGNLAQSRISENFPDWNCVDHISVSSPDPNVMAIQSLVEAGGGVLDKEQGAIQITLTSRSAALDIYKPTIKKCSFWKWDVTLDWDATQEDLELFVASISNAAVVHLTVHGHRLQERTSGAAKHSIRFRPLLELMSSGRVQSMCLVGFGDIFSSIEAAHRSPMPSLQELSIDTDLSCMNSLERNGLAAILDSCPQLKELLLSCKTIEPVLKFFAGIIKHLPRLQFLNLVSRGLRLQVHCEDGAIHEVAAEVTSWNEVPPEDRRLLQEGKSEDSTMEALRKKLEAVSLELRNTQLDLMDANDCLASTQEELEDTQAHLKETQLELQNAQEALANSERARQAANLDRILARPPRQQEVFVVLKFQSPQPLPVGGYRLFTLQEKAVERTLNQFIADNPELDAVVMDRLRFNRSPRGHNVFQQVKDDKKSPIKSSRRNFILKDDRTEDEMIEYITSVFKTHIQDTL
ncbi:unnamed protein product [Mortierella alpina]